MLGAAVALGAEEEKLRKLLPPEGGREIGQDAQQRDKDDDCHPKFSLASAKGLRLDTRDRAAQNEQPDQRKTNPHLAVEFGGVEAETVENFTHRVEGGRGWREKARQVVCQAIYFISRACTAFGKAIICKNLRA